MAKFAGILSEEKKPWIEAAQKRKALMDELLWDGTAYLDYDYKAREASSVFSVASFYPLWAGVADEGQAAKTVARLGEIEYEFGVSACAENPCPAECQWDYPTAWAPLQYIMIRALSRYGYQDDAKRIAEKYVKVTESIFEKTETLWEKYHVRTGENRTEADYQSREMIGWTAGVYLYAKEFLAKEETK